jgi:hypothetical protein
MAVWAWLLIAVGAALALSTVVGVALARVLGQIAEDVTDLLEGEEWSSAPLTRALHERDETREPVSREAGGSTRA